MSNLYGSLCVSDIPKELFKKAENGKIYLNIAVIERKEVSQFGHTHFISCAPKQEERKEGVNYFCGDMKTFAPKAPTPEQVEQAPSAEIDDLPFDLAPRITSCEGQ
ncbi:hypothetical protein [Bacteroides pyogenes]|uniref:hypothetical protein n=3 Tax=Bacteroides pyogenes TaxID=310300 RepID=UPI001BAC7250|nr:hypothetical protein [Bacteroides pyogenes]MBR8753908.1 hypothetical protein [Bacteroides pyogenes]MBR8808702.1 hypothetical protein [Bacteroides pyogenes]